MVQSGWQVGDRVCAMPFIACGRCQACANGRFFECMNKKVSGVDDQGGFAEYVTTGCRESIRLPDELDLQTAALKKAPSDVELLLDRAVTAAILLPG